ncbi:MAG: hypothetical protein ACK51L_03170 [bacterium]
MKEFAATHCINIKYDQACNGSLNQPIPEEQQRLWTDNKLM